MGTSTRRAPARGVQARTYGRPARLGADGRRRGKDAIERPLHGVNYSLAWDDTVRPCSEQV